MIPPYTTPIQLRVDSFPVDPWYPVRQLSAVDTIVAPWPFAYAGFAAD
jgi:hypothetical protein